MRTLAVFVTFCAATSMAQLCPVTLVNGSFDLPVPRGKLGNGWRFDGNLCGPGGWQSDGGNPGGVLWLNECGQWDSDPCATTVVTALCPGGAYIVQADIWSSGSQPSATDPFVITIDGVQMFTAQSLPAAEWRSVSVPFRPMLGAANLRFCAEASHSDTDFYLDNVRVVPSAVITQQPASVIASAGMPVTFVVVVQPPPGCETPIAYRWQKRATAELGGQWTELLESARFMNTRGPALVINNPGPAFATGYRCVITPGCGPELVTDEVNFEITCPSDFNADGGVDGDDVIAFFEHWDAGC